MKCAYSHARPFFSQVSWTFLLAFLCLAASSVFASSPLQQSPLTLSQITNLLLNKVDEEALISQIEQFKVDFDLTPEITFDLAQAGATRAVIVAVAKNRRGSILIQPQQRIPTPLTFDQIIELVRRKVPEADIIAQIRQLKVDFELTPDQAFELAEAGATRRLLEEIKANRFEQLTITSPTDGATCGLNVRIEGKSMQIASKYLWVFITRENLPVDVWWPQVGRVNVRDDGTWVQDGRLGEKQDIGYTFTIKALWVNSAVDQKIRDYMINCQATMSYPGLPLPKGDPSAQINVKKVSH